SRSVGSGVDASFVDRSDPATGVSGSAGAIYVLRWTISNAPCTASFDEATIKFNQNPTTAAAGADQTGFSTCGLTTVTLAGNSPKIGRASCRERSYATGTIVVERYADTDVRVA